MVGELLETLPADEITSDLVLVIASKSQRFKKLLAIEQQRLTDSLTDLIREAQSKGLYRKDFTPRALAVFIQSYSLGKIIDDVAISQVEESEWNNLVNLIIEKVYLDLP